MPADKDSLKGILHGVSRRPEPEDDLLMAEEETERQDVGPCGMVSVKGCRALDVDRGGKEPVISFQYLFINTMSVFEPGMFWVEFAGEKTWRLTVEGRNLRALHDRLQDHCLRRIRMVHRDFGDDDGKPFVTKIEVTDVTPKGE